MLMTKNLVKRTKYYENGNKEFEAYYHQDGKPIDGEHYAWYENGKLEMKFISKNGTLIKMWAWNRNGVLEYEGSPPLQQSIASQLDNFCITYEN
jgi:antitoxin component YwqK of YwqJK toxin-antitoxin module